MKSGGKVQAVKDRYKIVVEPRYGYRHLEPVPTAEELDSFYRDRYYDLVAAGGRAADLRRLLQGGEEAEAELRWLSQTLWRDVRDILDENTPRNNERWLLDIGCGLGHLGRYMTAAGWHVVGIEPSKKVGEIAKASGLTVYSSVGECLSENHQRFDAVTLLHVLEHVVDPVGLLQSVISLMRSRGMLVVAVPNDFSALQESAQKKLGIEPWWIAIPDHINYFNFESLDFLLRELGFQIVDKFCDFPMEFFLLFGENYIGNSEIGAVCHRKRVAFELAVPPKLRRDIYRCFARNGVGRSCLVFARLAGSGSGEGKG